MKRKALALVTLASLAAMGVVSLAGCAKGGMASGDHKARADKAGVGSVVELPAQSFARAWSLQLLPAGAGTVEWVRSSGDYLFVFTSERRCYVVAKASGKLEAIHQIESVGEVLAPVTNGKRVAYPVSTYVEVFELDGKPVRKINIDSAVQSPATLSDRLGFIAVSGSNGGRMRAVDPSRKYDTPYWELMVFGTVISAPVFFDQALFFATNTGRVYAVNEEKQPIWPIDNRYFQAGPVQADLTADEYGLYVASTDTKLTCINRSTGRVRWEYFAGEPLYAKPMATAETVYLSVRNTGLAAINKTEGDRIRQAKWVSRESTTFLAEDARYTYVRLRGNALGALDRATGAVAFRSAPSDLDFFVPNTGKDALIFAATKSGQLMAIRPVTKPGTVGELMFTTPKK